MKVEDLINRFNYRAQWREKDQVFVAFAVEMPSIQAHAVLPEDAISVARF